MELIITNRKGEKFTVLYDAEDYDKVMFYTWSVDLNRNTYYVTRKRRNEKGIKMHRFIMGVTDPNIIVDHINHNGLDNRKINLRLCSNAENVQHSTSRKNSTSKYLGVSWRSNNNKWLAQIQVNKVKIRIGIFADEKIAAIAYDRAAKLHFGEFANLNFKD